MNSVMILYVGRYCNRIAIFEARTESDRACVVCKVKKLYRKIMRESTLNRITHSQSCKVSRPRKDKEEY